MGNVAYVEQYSCTPLLFKKAVRPKDADIFLKRNTIMPWYNGHHSNKETFCVLNEQALLCIDSAALATTARRSAVEILDI